MNRIIVTDNNEIKEVATKEPVANCYAQFAYGTNGMSKKDAMRLAREAQAQQRREEEAYRA